MAPSSPWKKPDEIMKLHRLKKRKKALQERLGQPFSSNNPTSSNSTNSDADFSRIINGVKRRNPFSKTNNQQNKKVKTNDVCSQIEESSDNTLLKLINLSTVHTAASTKETEDKLLTFSNYLQKYTADFSKSEQIVERKHKHLPIDWALKTRLKLMSPKPFAWNRQLKASEEASGITGFVRCLNTKASSTLDTSPRALFHQTCLYWQHPHLPWVNLFPRTSVRISGTNNFIANNEEVKQALYKEWEESFRSLFQSLRARHCPYFYVCAGAFTCLFRAAGLCGESELTAMIAPTTRGLRHALRREDIEFEMPLKPEGVQKVSSPNSQSNNKNTSGDSCYDTMDEAKISQEPKKAEEGSDEGGDEDLDSDNFLSQMGFEAEDIKKINNTEARLQQNAESTVDSAAASLVLARGVDAQALFNWLLVCRTVVTGSGVPPTLLAPTAFQGGTLQALSVRESTVHTESGKYHSVEVRGPLLPGGVHALLTTAADCGGAAYSATCAQHPHTLAFTTAARVTVLAKESSKENEANAVASAFNMENLSDCGLSEGMLRLFCASDPKLIQIIDSIKYNKDDDCYSW